MRFTPTVLGLAMLFVGASCGDGGAVPTCVPGRTEACACVGGAIGAQECMDDGRFAACLCPIDVDGGAQMDAAEPVDASEPDATATSDSGPDAETVPDSGAADGGRPRGHVVIIGNSLWEPDEAFDRIFANAIFLGERGGTVRVLEYTERADAGWTGHSHDVMDAEAVARGRTLTRTALPTAAGLTAALPSADVLFVPVQVAASDAEMTAIAGFWAEPIVSFIEAGGVVVVCSWRSNGGPDGYEWRLVEAPALLGFTGGRTSFPSSTTVVVEVVDTTDPLVVGVATPFPTNGSNLSAFPTSARGTVVARSRDDLAPIVRHLVR